MKVWGLTVTVAPILQAYHTEETRPKTRPKNRMEIMEDFDFMISAGGDDFNFTPPNRGPSLGVLENWLDGWHETCLYYLKPSPSDPLPQNHHQTSHS